MRKTITAMAFATGLTLIAGASEAADFRTVYVDDELVLFDAESRIRTGNVVKVWELRIKPENPVEYVDPGITAWTMQRVEYDCSGQRWRGGPTSYYMSTGKPISEAAASKEWEDIIPATYGALSLKAACAPKLTEYKEKYETVFEAHREYLAYQARQKAEETAGK